MSSQHQLLRICIQCRPNLEEPLCNFLFEDGCPAVKLQERAEAILIQGFLPRGEENQALYSGFDTLTTNQRPNCRVNLPCGQDRREKETFKSFRISPALIGQVSCWEPKKPAPTGTIVSKNKPKTAFGSGPPPSAKPSFLAPRGGPKSRDGVLDCGCCGSGILAIYEARLGALEVPQVDNRSEVTIRAKENGVADIVKTRTDPRSLKRHCHDLAVENIDPPALTELGPRIIRALAKRGAATFS